MQGKIKFYNAHKGYGFIKGKDGNDYFFHFTSLKFPGYPKKDDAVTFDKDKNEKGLKAKNIEKQ